jgi:steroid delta-isomerase-like uncharacterized protein
MPESTAGTVRRFHRLAWSDGDLTAARSLLADDLVDHDPLAFPGRARGADGLLQVVAMIRAAFPDLRREIVDQVVDGDRVATCFVDRGTHRGDLMGIPASGRSIAIAGINVETVRAGRIAEVRHAEDLLGLMRQLGELPS